MCGLRPGKAAGRWPAEVETGGVPCLHDAATAFAAPVAAATAAPATDQGYFNGREEGEEEGADTAGEGERGREEGEEEEEHVDPMEKLSSDKPSSCATVEVTRNDGMVENDAKFSVGLKSPINLPTDVLVRPEGVGGRGREEEFEVPWSATPLPSRDV